MARAVPRGADLRQILLEMAVFRLDVGAAIRANAEEVAGVDGDEEGRAVVELVRLSAKAVMVAALPMMAGPRSRRARR